MNHGKNKGVRLNIKIITKGLPDQVRVLWGYDIQNKRHKIETSCFCNAYEDCGPFFDVIYNGVMETFRVLF